ncbi:MAG: type I 3-dehydroquinate dehydratase [Eubacteriales bacterium]|nr:type I 3-dehydroquinate dehydratase [Eubacteriales bacterium]
MSIKIREIEIGKGIPKICIPVTGTTREEIREQLARIKDEPFDLLEWRADFFEEISEEEARKEMIGEIREYLGEKPFLFTFRTKWEGGQRKISNGEYIQLLRAAAQTGKLDLLDVELFRAPELSDQLKEIKKDFKIVIIGSNHDFEKTPSKEEIRSRLDMMRQNGADIPKIAVMPQNAADVLTLLEATREFHLAFPDIPAITMSMGKGGMITRIAGETFGSAVTFASGVCASAPGQIPAKKLQEILEILHEKKK